MNAFDLDGMVDCGDDVGPRDGPPRRIPELRHPRRAWEIRRTYPDGKPVLLADGKPVLLAANATLPGARRCARAMFGRVAMEPAGGEERILVGGRPVASIIDTAARRAGVVGRGV